MAGKNYGFQATSDGPNSAFGNMQFRLVKAFAEGAAQVTSAAPPPANLYPNPGPEREAYISGQSASNPPGTAFGNPVIANRRWECLFV